jgi:hypothetical protein
MSEADIRKAVARALVLWRMISRKDEDIEDFVVKELLPPIEAMQKNFEALERLHDQTAEELSREREHATDQAVLYREMRAHRDKLQAALEPFAALVHEDGVEAPYPTEFWTPILVNANDAWEGRS